MLDFLAYYRSLLVEILSALARQPSLEQPESVPDHIRVTQFFVIEQRGTDHTIRPRPITVDGPNQPRI